ncbi:hypothetical protein BTS2_1775 [Bacillus sp. TS-2]|nr:hypothetical protein BTS2_1775 [Bacillus sp. TS-2]
MMTLIQLNKIDDFLYIAWEFCKYYDKIKVDFRMFREKLIINLDSSTFLR